MDCCSIGKVAIVVESVCVGMTAEGNHGGSTAEEVTSSALFYAPAGVTRSGFDFSDDIVAASAVQQVSGVCVLLCTCTQLMCYCCVYAPFMLG